MINNKYIMVYDLETSSTDPYTTDIIQISCLAVHPESLTIVEDSVFDSFVRPDGMNDRDQYYNENKSTFDWHANNQGCSVDDFLDKIDAAPSEKVVMSAFSEYLKNYHDPDKRRSRFTTPIRAGFNIINFDNIIMDRVCAKYGMSDKDGKCKLFDRRIQIDIMHLAWLWLKDQNILENLKMDTLRDKFAISKVGAHDGKKDVIDEAELMIKFLNLNKVFSNKVKWLG